MIWDDITHRPQLFNAAGEESKPIPVKPDLQLRSYYKKLISLRKNRSDLKFGAMEYVVADDKEMTLAYCREDKKNRSVIVFNFGESSRILQFKKESIKNVVLLEETRPGALISTALENGFLKIKLSSTSGAALSIH